ncbi:MAG: ORF6N domain-containing protein [Armatimonadota bacterium]
MTESTLVPVESIAGSIRLLRGQKVILDSDLARLYGTSTTRLNEQVKRNIERFPVDFMFRLTDEENQLLTSQNAISKPGRGGRRTIPYAFTEHGALMAASVLNTSVAVEVSVHVVRAFVKMREMLSTQAEVSLKFRELEARLDEHDEHIGALIGAIHQLLAPSEAPDRRMGFRQPED